MLRQHQKGGGGMRNAPLRRNDRLWPWQLGSLTALTLVIYGGPVGSRLASVLGVLLFVVPLVLGKCRPCSGKKQQMGMKRFFGLGELTHARWQSAQGRWDGNSAPLRSDGVVYSVLGTVVMTLAVAVGAPLCSNWDEWFTADYLYTSGLYTCPYADGAGDATPEELAAAGAASLRWWARKVLPMSAIATFSVLVIIVAVTTCWRAGPASAARGALLLQRKALLDDQRVKMRVRQRVVEGMGVAGFPIGVVATGSGLGVGGTNGAMGGSTTDSSTSSTVYSTHSLGDVFDDLVAEATRDSRVSSSTFAAMHCACLALVCMLFLTPASLGSMKCAATWGGSHGLAKAITVAVLIAGASWPNCFFVLQTLAYCVWLYRFPANLLRRLSLLRWT